MFLIKHFIASAIHLGHQTNKWNPRTASFLFAVKGDLHLIDLELTIPMLRRALNLIKKICSRRGSILYAGGLQGRGFAANYQQRSKQQPAASGLSSFSSTKMGSAAALAPARLPGPLEERGRREAPRLRCLGARPITSWLLGLKLSRGGAASQTTNINSSPRKTPMAVPHGDGSSIPRPIANGAPATTARGNKEGPQAGLRNFGHGVGRPLNSRPGGTGLRGFAGAWGGPIPEALFILNVNENSVLIKEALKLQLSVVAVVDSDTDPFGVQYPIPGNDDSIEAADAYIGLLLDAIADAKKNEFTALTSGQDHIARAFTSGP